MNNNAERRNREPSPNTSNTGEIKRERTGNGRVRYQFDVYIEVYRRAAQELRNIYQRVNYIFQVPTFYGKLLPKIPTPPTTFNCRLN